MNLRSTRLALLALVGLIAVAVLVFHLFERQLSRAWFAFGVHPDVLSQLELSRGDQKRLARADPVHAADYHRRFLSIQALLAKLRILELNRAGIVGRYEAVLLALFAGALVLGGVGWTVRQGRQEARLGRLQAALAELAAGRTDLDLGEGRRDLIGRIAGMVEETSRAMARDRRRLASLENLSAWQEAARRHAHEMRTPLTAARLEVQRLRGLHQPPAAEGRVEAAGETTEEAVRAADSVLQELDRLGRFTRGFTTFARLQQPVPRRQDLTALLSEFVELFAAAWPNLELRFAPGRPCEAAVDREMVRQALVNLADNAALALGDRRGSLTLSLDSSPVSGAGGWVHLDAVDDGPGIAPAVLPRLFEPYTTSRGVGEGMGLGLAISRKILLDHGGDLELLRTGPAGTAFRLSFPAVSAVQDGGRSA